MAAPACADPIPRRSGRVVLIGPGGRTLLFRGGDPHRPEDGTWWFTPGGGAEADETTFAAARRELWEETGQREVEWGGLVARREAVFTFLGAAYRSLEEFYVAYTANTAVVSHGFTDVELEAVAEYRWLEEPALRLLPEPVYPPELAEYLAALVARDTPVQPWVWG